MALSPGTGPFAHRPAGQTNFRIEGPAHRLYLDDYPRRIRAELGGETVIDTVDGKLLYESSLSPVLYVPQADVRADLIEPTDHTTHCPFKGDASYWTVRGNTVAENALWGYPEPIAEAAWLLGYVAAYWGRFDAWYEEEERINRIRDPYHRVDIRPTAAHVTVRAHGEVIAESAQARLLFETGLPPRAYLPLADVRGDVLVANANTTYCPYKGTATYWSVRAGGRTIEDAAWTYAEPYDESAAAAGLISFLADGVEVEIDRSATPRLRAAA